MSSNIVSVSAASFCFFMRRATTNALITESLVVTRESTMDAVVGIRT